MANETYLEENFRFFKFLAYEKLDPDASVWKKLLHKAIRVMAIAVSVHVMIFSVCSVWKGESPEFNILTAEITLCVIIRLFYQYTFDETPARIVETMNVMFKSSSSTGLKEVTMTRYRKICRWLVKLGLLVDVSTVSFVTVMPLLFGSGRVLPLPAWLPYDWTQSPWYEVTYAIQAASEMCTAISFFNSDLFLICTLFLTTGQFRILGWEIKNLLYKILLQNDIPENVVSNFRKALPCSKEINFSRGDFTKIYEILETKKCSDDIFREFSEMVSFHQRLLSFCDELETFFSPLLFLTLSWTPFHVIFIEFILLTTDDNSLRMSMIMYLCGSLYHSFWPVLFGQLLTNQTEKLMNDLYELPWYLCDNRFKATFKFIHLRMTKPFALTMAKLAEVNINIFAWILRTSFSYFTFLRQVTQEP